MIGVEIEMKSFALKRYPASMGPIELPIPQIVELIADADARSSAVTVPIK